MEEKVCDEAFRMIFPEARFSVEDGCLHAEIHLCLGLSTSSSSIKTTARETGDSDFKRVLELFEKMTRQLGDFRKYLVGIHSEYRKLLEEKTKRWKKKIEATHTREERAKINLEESIRIRDVYEFIRGVPGLTIEEIKGNGPYMVNAHICYGDCSLNFLFFENREGNALLKVMEYVLSAFRSIEIFENRWNGFWKMISGMSEQYNKEEDGNGR